LYRKARTEFYPKWVPSHIATASTSAILVDQVSGKWKTETLGAANLAKLIASARNGAQTSNASQDAVVAVRSLGLYFLGHRTGDNKLTLSPLADNTAFGFRAGGAMPAEEVFAALVPAAKSLNTDAPM
jgi:hypothetical protein